MDELPQNPTTDDTQNSEVTPANARDAAKAAAAALVDADTPQPQSVQPPQAPAQDNSEMQQESGEQETETQTVASDTTPGTPPSQGEATSAPEETEDDEEYSAPVPAPTQVPQLDSSKFIDENGYVDVKAMTDAFNQSIAASQQAAAQAAQAEVNAQRFEERQWNQAIDKYPQLKSDRTLRDIVQSARIGKTTDLYQRAGNDPQKLAAIKIPTPTQVASELFKRLGEAKTQGVKEATETVRVQQNTTYQETASTPGEIGAPSKKAELFGQIRNNDPIKANAAQRDLLKALVFDETNN